MRLFKSETSRNFYWFCNQFLFSFLLSRRRSWFNTIYQNWSFKSRRINSLLEYGKRDRVLWRSRRQAGSVRARIEESLQKVGAEISSRQESERRREGSWRYNFQRRRNSSLMFIYSVQSDLASLRGPIRQREEGSLWQIWRIWHQGGRRRRRWHVARPGYLRHVLRRFKILYFHFWR